MEGTQEKGALGGGRLAGESLCRAIQQELNLDYFLAFSVFSPASTHPEMPADMCLMFL